MSPMKRQRDKAIISHAEALLPNSNYGDGHNFMISHEEALTVGQAVATRNHKKLRDTLSGAIDQLEDHYESFSIEDLKGEWEAELQRVTGEDGSFLDFMDDSTKAAKLDDCLARRDGTTRLELKPIAYVKLLETIAYATAADDLDAFDPRAALSTRRRKRGNLYSRSVTILEQLCTDEPGVRQIREKLLAGDESALDAYFVNLSRMRVAQKAYANIIETFEDGNAGTQKYKVRHQLDIANGFNELLNTHILSWEMLPKEITDSPDRNRAIKTIISDNSKNKSLVGDRWNDERIDVLFETANLASSQGRSADIYISSTFDGGAGLYLAAVLAHPLDSDKKLVVADNPLKGNALYIVDEQLTEYDEGTGEQYEWREVLGVYRRVARARGARRRYHTGDWSQLPRAVCEYGGNYKLAEQKKREYEQSSSSVQEPKDVNGAYEGLLAAIARANDISQSIIIDK